ncbi:transketolase [Actinomadura graeca]|uniref:Transketolase n=1 Tax=Actinomadura graeca TaxID=2750812 RepID=A0ABX8QWP7_9ACTN|nr:transketolase C-terminal domain-containing protein [Actinomadura graeca]QXJ22404.1 transketolase [Actinomadura graeca]
MTEQVPPDRNIFRDTLVPMMAEDPRLVCLDSDTGLYDGIDFGPAADRYINLGIAEQDLMGVAAGLAKSGRVPVVNTMATFASTRALEFVKIDIAYNAVPVRIAATHSGLSAGSLGPTHHSLEDLAVMRTLPNMTVLVSAGGASTEALFRQCVDLPGPVYLRLGRGPTPQLPEDAPPVRIGEAQVLRHGDDVTLVACGPYPVEAALLAAERLADLGVEAAVLNMHTVKPLDVTTLLEFARRSRLVVTVEEHWETGGLGAAVGEALAPRLPVQVRRVAVSDEFVSMAGDHPYLLERTGIRPDAVVDEVRDVLGDLGREDEDGEEDEPG